MARTSYAIGLGSNRRHGRHGGPSAVLKAAIASLAAGRMEILALSRIRLTPALGPAGRSFANAAMLVRSELQPPDLLRLLKALEQEFGRRPGRRWGPRVLDLDILLWSQGAYEGPGLIIPHPAMRERDFVLDPLCELAPDWRDPISGLTVRQLFARLSSRPPLG